MFWTNLKRIVRSGYRNFVRSGFTSLASVLVMTVALFVFGSLIFLQATLQSSLQNIKNKVDVTAYFVAGTPEDTIFAIEDELNTLPEVASVTYTSEDQALANFKTKHADDYLTLQALDELDSNPLGASLDIKAKDPSQYESISNFFDADTSPLSSDQLASIDTVDYAQNAVVIDHLNSIINGAKRLGVAVSLVLIFISIIITFNTIRLTIYMSREEISVMRLVGAGNKYIRGPFIVSGILVGCFASVATILIFWPVSWWLGQNMTSFLGLNLYTYYLNNLFELFFIMLFFGIAIGSMSSIMAIHRYLRK